MRLSDGQALEFGDVDVGEEDADVAEVECRHRETTEPCERYGGVVGIPVTVKPKA